MASGLGPDVEKHPLSVRCSNFDRIEHRQGSIDQVYPKQLLIRTVVRREEQISEIAFELCLEENAPQLHPYGLAIEGQLPARDPVLARRDLLEAKEVNWLHEVCPIPLSN